MNIELLEKVATIVAAFGVPALFVTVVKEMAARLQRNPRHALFNWLSSEAVQRVVAEDEPLRALCDEQRRSYIFRRLFGISIERELRDVLVTFHKERAGRYTMRQIAHASLYLTWTGKTFRIKNKYWKFGHRVRKFVKLLSKLVAYFFFMVFCLSLIVRAALITQYLFLGVVALYTITYMIFSAAQQYAEIAEDLVKWSTSVDTPRQLNDNTKEKEVVKNNGVITSR